MLSSSSVGRSDKRCGLSSGSQLEDFKEEHVFLFVFFNRYCRGRDMDLNS